MTGLQGRWGGWTIFDAHPHTQHETKPCLRWSHDAAGWVVTGNARLLGRERQDFDVRKHLTGGLQPGRDGDGSHVRHPGEVDHEHCREATGEAVKKKRRRCREGNTWHCLHQERKLRRKKKSPPTSTTVD